MQISEQVGMKWCVYCQHYEGRLCSRCLEVDGGRERPFWKEKQKEKEKGTINEKASFDQMGESGSCSVSGHRCEMEKDQRLFGDRAD